MKRWTLPELIAEKVFGIVKGLFSWQDHELEPVLTIEYEIDTDNDNPYAWLRTDHYRQMFRYAHLRTVIQVFRNTPLYLSPKSERTKSHLLVVKTSYKTYGLLAGIAREEAED